MQIANRSRGFSFVEVLFAVIILGIGFIMIAAIFPVAIQQTQACSNDVTAATIARQAVAALTAAATDATMPATGANVVPILYSGTTQLLWDNINGNMILSGDSRYAWTALYRRDNSLPPYAQVFVIVGRVQNRSSYDLTVDAPKSTPTPAFANLACRAVTVTLADGGTGTDTATISGTAASAVAEGTFLVLQNGGIYRIGSQISTNTWELAAGSDMADATENVSNATAYILGRECTAASTYDGPAQDIAVYSTYIPVN